MSAAGAVKHDEIVNMVGRLFTNFSTDPTTADQLVNANPAVFTGSEVCVITSLNLSSLCTQFVGLYITICIIGSSTG